MILPQTYIAALLLMIAALVCQGSWANTVKLAGRRSWRFELYYFDFAIGVSAMALVCGLTFGSLGFDGFALLDDFIRAGKRQWLFGFLAGVMFNLSNMLLVGAVSVMGMAVAFPLVMGITILVVAVWLGGALPKDSTFLIAGCVLIAIAMAMEAAAYVGRVRRVHEEAKREGKVKRGSRPKFLKPLALCLAGGVVGGLSYPLQDWARAGEAGLGPYGGAVMFAMGLTVSTFVFNLFFMNLPVEGEPLEIPDYIKGGLAIHRFGLIGGAIFAVGVVASFVAAAAQSEAVVGHAAMLGLWHGGALVAALCGLVVWKELRGGAGLVWLGWVVFAGGLALFALAFAGKAA